MSRARAIDLGQQPVQNIVPDPLPSSAHSFWSFSNHGASGVGSASYDSATSSYMDTITTAPTNNTWTCRVGSVGATSTPVVPGQWIAQSIWVNPSIADARAYTIDFFAADGTTAVNHSPDDTTVYTVRTALPANTWTQLYYQVQVPPGAFFASLHVVWTGNSGPTAGTRVVGSTTKVRLAVALMSPFPISAALARLYQDRNTPGWKGVGATTVRSSYSVGWPYTLENIAGKPLADVLGVGNVDVSTSVLGALEGRTVYSVVDRVSVNPSVVATTFNDIRPSTGQTSGLRQNSNGTNANYEVRPQFVNGGGAGGVYSVVLMPNAVALGRHTMSAAYAQGLATLSGECDQGATSSRTGMTVGDGFSAGGGMTVTGASIEAPVRSLLFRGEHGAETRRRVIAWLARQYGSPIPSGY